MVQASTPAEENPIAAPTDDTATATAPTPDTPIYDECISLLRGGAPLSDVPAWARSDKPCVLAAVTADGSNLQHADEPLREDAEVAAAALQQTWKAFEHVGSTLRLDPDCLATYDAAVRLHFRRAVKAWARRRSPESARPDELQALLQHTRSAHPAAVQQALLEAVALGASGECISCLLQAAHASPRDASGRTLLHIAAAYDTSDVSRMSEEGCPSTHAAALDVILSLGACVNARDTEGRTPLHLAAESTAMGVFLRLVEAGACIGACDNTGRTALHHAAATAWGDDTHKLRVLLRAGASPHTADAEGRTPLLCAAASGCSLGALRLLLAEGADAAAADACGMAAAHHACCSAWAEGVAVLLGHGAAVGQCDAAQRTPLHHAAAASQGTEVLSVLLDNGACVDASDESGMTPVLCAAEHAGPALCEVLYLARHGADLHAQDGAGRTAFLLACGSEASLESLAALAALGVDLRAVDAEGAGAVEYAARRGQQRAKEVEALLSDLAPQEVSWFDSVAEYLWGVE